MGQPHCLWGIGQKALQWLGTSWVGGGNPPLSIHPAHTRPLGAGHLLLPPPLHRSLHRRTQWSGPHIPARTQTLVPRSPSTFAFCRGPGMRPPHYPRGPRHAAPDGCPLGTQASGSGFSLPVVLVCRPRWYPPGAAAHVSPRGPTSLTWSRVSPPWCARQPPAARRVRGSLAAS